jgi:hypothetical protein
MQSRWFSDVLDWHYLLQVKDASVNILKPGMFISGMHFPVLSPHTVEKMQLKIRSANQTDRMLVLWRQAFNWNSQMNLWQRCLEQSSSIPLVLFQTDGLTLISGLFVQPWMTKQNYKNYLQGICNHPSQKPVLTLKSNRLITFDHLTSVISCGGNKNHAHWIKNRLKFAKHDCLIKNRYIF